MAKLVRIETFHVALPTRREHKWTGLTEPIGGYVLVRLLDDDGAEGWGEAPGLKDWGGDWGRYFGETPGTTIHVIERYLGPAIAGGAAGDFADLHSRMDKAIKGFPYAKAAIDIAAYELAASRLRVPVWQLLGGRARSRVPVTHSIGLIDIETAEREAATVVGQGIRTIKIKVGVDPERDVEIVKRVRAAVGEQVELCVDANQGYATPADAIRTFRRMEPHRIKYFEQPVEGIHRLAEVARAIDTPVMADESAWTARDVVEIAEQRAAQIVSIYTTKPGGLYRAMEMAAVCRATGIACNVNGSVETGVGNRANVHLAAAAQSVTLSCVVPVSTPAETLGDRIAGIYYRDDLISAPMRLVDGAIEVGDQPGFGTAVDRAKIERYRVRQS